MSNIPPEPYYNQTLAFYRQRLQQLQTRIRWVALCRTLLALGIIALIYLVFKHPCWLMGPGLLGLLIPFLALLRYHSAIAKQATEAEGFILLCEQELQALQYDFGAFDGAPEKQNPDHSYSFDLDIFGEHSFFQSINRTVSHGGREKLASWLLSPLSSKAAIEARQQALAELAQQPELRQLFCVTGRNHKGQKDDVKILESIHNHNFPFTKNPFWRWCCRLLPFIWPGLIAGWIWAGIGPALPTAFFLLCTVVANIKIKQINNLHGVIHQMEGVLAVYARLLKLIEQQHYASPLLQDIRKALGTPKTSASKAVMQLSRILNALDMRSNMAMAIVNIFIFRDIRTAIRFADWKESYAKLIPAWFDALADFDALVSLAGLAYNRPFYTFPQVEESGPPLTAKALGHPLLPHERCVRNDISVDSQPWFMIITGANMAGKSTYLRTVGLNYVLACIGAPVCAESCRFSPVRLITSLRTSDSLSRNESYFYAELKRIKEIIDLLADGERLFIILDEILRGTNSADKRTGSLALIRQCLRYQACGLIATHDVILGSLIEEYPKYIRNYRFEADIDGDTLSFSYALRPGVAENMNACFLMQQMGIQIENTQAKDS